MGVDLNMTDRMNLEMAFQRIFVYGSFCQGMVHYDKISKYLVASTPARAQGSVYRLQVGYPVYLNQGQDWVPGQLMEVEAPEVLFRILDEFHGHSPLQPNKSLYQKVSVQVTLTDSGDVSWATTYALNPSKLPRSAQKIEGGDWKRALAERPSLVESLSAKQLQYIGRLGTSTGREIVPIDLQLYRELMNLDLIVDKGRRLALSSLGKEVYRFLPSRESE